MARSAWIDNRGSTSISCATENLALSLVSSARAQTASSAARVSPRTAALSTAADTARVVGDILAIPLDRVVRGAARRRHRPCDAVRSPATRTWNTSGTSGAYGGDVTFCCLVCHCPRGESSATGFSTSDFGQDCE